MAFSLFQQGPRPWRSILVIVVFEGPTPYASTNRTGGIFLRLCGEALSRRPPVGQSVHLAANQGTTFCDLQSGIRLWLCVCMGVVCCFGWFCFLTSSPEAESYVFDDTSCHRPIVCSCQMCNILDVRAMKSSCHIIFDSGSDAAVTPVSMICSQHRIRHYLRDAHGARIATEGVRDVSIILTAVDGEEVTIVLCQQSS